jgi:hypothetical protein
MTSITFLAASLLKENPVQSKDPKVGELMQVQPGLCLSLKADPQDVGGQHLRIELADGMLKTCPRRVWHCFKPHLRVDESANRGAESKPVTDLSRNKADRGPKIVIAGRADGIYLYDPVSPKSPSFFWYELLHGGSRLPASKEVTAGMVRIAEELQPWRDKIGEPFIITSGYRPPAANAAAGGASNSRHLYGDALDLYWASADKYKMYQVFDDGGWNGGLGIYPSLNIVHVDARGYIARWGG